MGISILLMSLIGSCGGALPVVSADTWEWKSDNERRNTSIEVAELASEPQESPFLS